MRQIGSMERLSGDIKKVALIHIENTFMPPLGLLSIGAMLEKIGREVIVVPVFGYGDREKTDMLSESVERLKNFNPDLIGIGFMSAESKAAKAVIGRLKNDFDDAVIVAGGRHPSNFPRHVLRWGADFVIVGEGETTLSELIDALSGEPSGLKNVRGLAFLDKDGVICFSPRVEETADLDLIPAYHLVPYQRFIDTRMALVGRYLRSGWVATSRGCFSKCSYCRDPNFGRKLRPRSMNAVMDDVRLQLENYDLDCFYIIDDMFAANEERVMEFCGRFLDTQKKFKRKLYFAATARGDTLTRPMVEAMKRAGCTQLSIGLESGSQRILDFLDTRKNVSDAVNAFEMLKGSGIDTFVNLMVGVPVEEEGDIAATVNLVRRLRPTLVGVSFLTAYPGTPLYDRALKEGWIEEGDESVFLSRHSDDKSQLKFGIAQSVLQDRKRAIYKESLGCSIGNFFRKKESWRLARDLLKISCADPGSVFSLASLALRGDADGSKELYRSMIYKNAWSAVR